MEFKLHHIGIAVKEIGPIARIFEDKLGLSFENKEEVENQHVRVSFSKEQPSVELVEASNDKSPYFPMLPHPIKAFISKKGEGLHHICFSVKNLDDAFKEFSDSKVKILGNTIQTGSKGKRIFFIDPVETAGILIEIKEEKEQ
jgi:methylmalonyl-CoA/ethylmalonyl-CoA epimerase